MSLEEVISPGKPGLGDVAPPNALALSSLPSLRALDPKLKPPVSDFWSPTSNVGSSLNQSASGKVDGAPLVPKEDPKCDGAPFRCEVCLCACSFAHIGILFVE